MKHSLMLIESPNKINTITKYLRNTNIEVFATIGHIRELDERSYRGFGFEEKTYKMKWRNNSKRSFKGKEFDVIEEINKKADKSDEIFLSTDPDREGEAISWHIYSILSEKNQKKCKRIIFNEITQDAIKKAFEHPRDLDQNQINSYLARKILDRGIGFKLSDFSQKFIGGASAGRVQSIALKFLKDKYDEIQAFVPDHWFNVRVRLENGLELNLKKLNDDVKVDLKDVDNGNINFVSEEETQKFLETLDDYFDLVGISDPKKEKRTPPHPFKTSTMQSTAISALGFSVDNVDRIAQRLYEGVEIDGDFLSLITYPRTDREDLSDTFVGEAKSWLLSEYGSKYVAAVRKTKKSSGKALLVQGAHEAIRPTYVHLTPKDLEGKIDGQFLKLYRLIWLRAVGSLMKEAKYDNVLHTFDNGGNEFVVNNRIETFDGFQRLIRNFKRKGEEDADDEKTFPPLKLHEKYKSDAREVKRVDKRPPSPYTESTLIKSLEDRGIGRPSTYSHIVNIILKREYANKVEGKLIITDLGIQMSQELSKFFPNVMQYDYTKNMEQSLDNISEDKSDWKQFLDDVFLVFNGELEKALTQVKNLVVGTCPECGGDLKKKYSIRGPKRASFIGCGNYPKCKYIQNNQSEKSDESLHEKTGELCPECGGDLVRKMSKWKKEFVGCSKYPSCSYIKRDTPPVEEVGRDCPKCQGKLVKKLNKWKRPFISCQQYPKCKYIESLDEREKTDELCPECGGGLWKYIGRYNRPYLKCESESCKFYKTIKKSNDDAKKEP